MVWRRVEKPSFHFINCQFYVVETVLVHIEFGRKGDDDNHDYPVYDNENMNSPYQHNFSKNKNIT